MTHSSVVKSLEQINKAIEKGNEFAKKHPRSAFGTDNVASVKLTNRILEKARDGASIDELERYIEILPDEDYMTATDTIQWLSGDIDEDLY